MLHSRVVNESVCDTSKRVFHMEFPGLGKHCSDPSCQQLDYLPLKCDACEQLFCREHIVYNSHNCPSAYKKDVQVPVCPLCNTPIPVKRGELPDVTVGAHIDNDCMSDPAKSRRKIFTNKCSAKGCHVKEIVRVICNDCKMNFCLKHRHPTDHQCEGAAAAARRRAAEAAEQRQSIFHTKASTSNQPSRSRPVQPQRNVSYIQGNMSEDEALALALALSLQESNDSQQNGAVPTSVQQQLEEDCMLARAVAESERRQRGTSNLASKDRCIIS